MATPMDEQNAAISTSKPNTNNNSRSIPKIDPAEFTLRKRLPRRLPKRKNDIYVSNKTDFKAQEARCHKLLDTGVNEIHIHGLGAAVNRAVNLALQLQKSSLGTFQMSVHTSTVDLTDDLEPTGDDAEPETRDRHNSAIHIKISRTEEAPSK